ncbi:unnamed protein product [Polarella glacialis]|uniref:Beta-amylase n=1 Tax=Polarella glacialis TaxID=89957 RepID=A0A813EJY5_POLGL|nr:unnamed protein product [Polarella glacialis]CAE8676212.1 unnamed protein product [Polarella glacialis]
MACCFNFFNALGGKQQQQEVKKSILPVSPGKCLVFVMLQLDWLSDDGQSLRNKADMRRQLTLLKTAGVRGVMGDIWWGLCEPQPGKYHFGGVLELCDLLQELGLQLQAVMSFHQCGGNVGDTATYPLPAWALDVAKEKGLLYTSRAGAVSEDCLSLSADKEVIFPSTNGGPRTALQCYQDYMAAFVGATGSHMGTTVCELQIGMGPCGELRYPSYQMSSGWNWPGVGLVMAHDSGMLRMLKAETGMDEPPAALPEEQNALPDDIPCFRAAEPGADASSTGFRSGPCKVFLEWYSSALMRHGRDMLTQATLALHRARCSPSVSGLTFSVKVSGLHWHVTHPSRATEACAGYNCCTSDSADAYCSIAKLLADSAKVAKRPVIFNFTCMEMTNNSSGGVPTALSAPEDLIAQVRRACINHNVPLAGENALEFDLATSGWAFDQMEKQIRSYSPGRDAMHGITLLRLGDGFVKPDSLEALGHFVSRN